MFARPLPLCAFVPSLDEPWPHTDTHGGNARALFRSVLFHDYGLIWTPDRLQWTVDGSVVRTLERSDTEDANIAGLYHFPSTPMRVQFSLWSVTGTSQGTVDWAGGEIDWDNVPSGFVACEVDWVDVSCLPLDQVEQTVDWEQPRTFISAPADGAPVNVPRPTLPAFAPPPPDKRDATPYTAPRPGKLDLPVVVEEHDRTPEPWWLADIRAPTSLQRRQSTTGQEPLSYVYERA